MVTIPNETVLNEYKYISNSDGSWNEVIINLYWSKIGELLRLDGKMKYKNLVQVVVRSHSYHYYFSSTMGMTTAEVATLMRMYGVRILAKIQESIRINIYTSVFANNLYLMEGGLLTSWKSEILVSLFVACVTCGKHLSM